MKTSIFTCKIETEVQETLRKLKGDLTWNQFFKLVANSHQGVKMEFINKLPENKSTSVNGENHDNSIN